MGKNLLAYSKDSSIEVCTLSATVKDSFRVDFLTHWFTSIFLCRSFSVGPTNLSWLVGE